MANTIFSDWLQALGVPHTVAYSDSQFQSMPFDTLFGLSKLLQSYGIVTEGYNISDKSEIKALTPPFIADTPDGMVIVTAIDGNNVSYLTQGESETMPLDEFTKAWNGIVLLAYPDSKSREPDYGTHRRVELINESKKYILMMGAVALFAYLFITNGLYRSWSTIGLTVVNIAGIVFSFMLVQKSLNIKNKAADAVCGVLQEGGCDKILELKVSSFFGIFKWSEVGLTYFTVSLMTLLVFPQFTPYLALCNACCLPYTVWSIWYQKFRAHHWCTLCVSVQTSLWLLFFCYFFGGWYHGVFPLRIEFFVLVVTYVTVLLAINKISPFFNKKETSYENQADSATTA